LAIGIEVEVAKVLGIFLAVLFHKWAEGLTLVNHDSKIYTFKYYYILT